MLNKAGFATLVPIKEMDRAVEFYTEKLGGKLVYRGKGKTRNSFAQIKMGKEEFWLIPPTKWEQRDLSYSTFIVKNIKKSVKNLEKSGVKFEPGEKMGEESKVKGPITYDSFGAAAFFHDTEGNLLMLWQNDM